MSRLEQKLQKDIGLASSVEGRWAARLRHAGYLARTGRLQSAKQVVLEARQASLASGRVLAAVNLTESLIEFHQSQLKSAIDKIRRSMAIAKSTNSSIDTYAHAAAWCAHYHRNTGQWPELVSSIQDCLESIGSDDYESMARLALVIADSFLEIGRMHASGQWYEIARKAANICGDETLIASLIHNRCVLRVYRLRLSEVTGDKSLLDECLVSLEEASARNYISYTNNESMVWMLDVLRGQVLTIQEQFDAAVKSFSGVTDDSLLPGWPHVKAICHADVAYCLARQGVDQGAVLEWAKFPMEVVEHLPDAGDATLVALRLSESFELLKMPEVAARMKQAGVERYAVHEEYCTKSANRIAACLQLMSARMSEVLPEYSRGALW